MEFLNNNMFAELPEEDIRNLESFLEEKSEIFHEEVEVEVEVEEEVEYGN